MFSEIQFFFESCWSTACSASIARWLACDDACGNPPTARSSSSLVRFRASSTLLPRSSSARAEPHDFQCELQNVAARWILDARRCIRIGYRPRVAWVFKMIENLG
jgi:hypothetical protein